MSNPLATGLRALLAAMPGWVWPGIGILMLWTGIGLQLAHEHTRVMEQAQVNGANLARAFRESMLRTIHEIDQTLLFVRALHSRDGDRLDLRPWVEGAGAEIRLALQIATADRNGIVRLSNLRPVTERIDLSDRPHFRHFADMPADAPARDQLYIGAPVLGRVSQAWTIQFVRPLRTQDGAFDGMAVLSVPPAHLTRFYGSIDTGMKGSVTLIGLDRVIRARAGPAAAAAAPQPGPTVSASPAAVAAATADEGGFEWVDPVDGIRRIEHFARVPGYPLVVSVGLARDEILAAGEDTRRTLLAGGLVLTVLLALLGWAIRQGQRDLASARASTQVAVENLGLGIILVAPDGRIALLNRPAAELLDIPPHFGRGSRFTDLVAWQRSAGEFGTGTDTSLRQVIEQSDRPDRTLPGIYRRRRPNGTWLEVRTIQLPDGSSLRAFRDVTDWENAQAALVAARDAAEAASQARARFLAVMSHEIRTPLNGILGIAELLADNTHEPEEARLVAVIRQSGQHLLDLLNDILDFSKIDQHGIEPEALPFDPAQVLRDAIDLVAPRAAEQGLVLECRIDPALPARVLGDAHRLRQVVLNLLGNAIKFTRQGSVTAHLAATREDGGPKADAWRLSFTISDTGIGIAPEVLPRLFQEFFQMDGSITRRFGGSGLGLAISRRLVEAMGGAISADSTPGRGSAFRFHIRAGAAPHDLASQPEGPSPEDLLAARRPRVLLAEDNRVNRLVATRMAEKLGCRVAAVTDGRAAVAAVTEGACDIVLMDVMMPEMDGLAATRAIRALPGPAARLPIIGLSANAFRSDQEEALAAGMNGFVTKPVTLPALAAAMAAALAPPAPEAPAPEAPAEEAPAEEAWAAGVSTASNSAHPPPPTPPPAPPPALAALADILGAETATLIARAFTDEAPSQFARLTALAGAGDGIALGREAHALAGSAGTVGLDALAAALRAVERSVRQGARPDPAAIAALAPLLHDGMAALGAPSLAESA